MSAQAATGHWVCVVDRNRGAAGLELYPEAGRPSPAIARAGSVSVVFDGHLADRPELAGRLTSGSAPDGDAEVVLAAYQRFGEGLLSRISGTFAAVIWDAGASRLLCARDPVGIHPVVHANVGETLALAPSEQALLRHPGVLRHVDPVAAIVKVLGWPLRLEETLFEGIRRIPPGHALDVSRAGTRLFRYWDPGEPGEDEGITAREAAERFDALFRRAVDRCVELDPAAVFLSGGIDSAAVAAVAAEVNGKRKQSPPLGLSLMVDHPDLDEEPNQRAVAADLGMELLPVSIEQAVGSGRLLRATLEVSASGSAGPAEIIQPIYDVLARKAIRRGRTTLLNGQGGDEWLLPSRPYALDRLRALDVAALYRLWHAWYQYFPPQSNVSLARLFLWTFGVRPLVRASALSLGRSAPRVRALHARRILEGLPGWLAPDTTLRHELVERALSTEPPISPGASFRDSRRELLDRPDRPGVTEEAFAMHRRLGARMLMPMLDADLVRFLYRLPADLLVDRGRAKALAREVVGQRLPSFGGRWPRTVSGDRYYGRLLQREAPAAWQAAGGTPCLAELRVVDASKVLRHVEVGSSLDAARIWSATNLDVWLRSSLGEETPVLAPR